MASATSLVVHKVTRPGHLLLAGRRAAPDPLRWHRRAAATALAPRLRKITGAKGIEQSMAAASRVLDVPDLVLWILQAAPSAAAITALTRNAGTARDLGPRVRRAVWGARLENGTAIIEYDAGDDDEEHENANVLAIALSPDGRRVCLGGQDGLARVFEVASGESLSVLRGSGIIPWAYVEGQSNSTLNSHGIGACVFPSQCPFSNIVVTAETNHRTGGISHCRLFDASSGAELISRNLGPSIRTCVFNRCGSRLAACGRGIITLWNVDVGGGVGYASFLVENHALRLDCQFSDSCSFSADGAKLLVLENCFSIAIVDVLNPLNEYVRIPNPDAGEYEEFYQCVFSPDAQNIYVVGSGGAVSIFDTTGNQLRRISYDGVDFCSALESAGRNVVVSSESKWEDEPGGLKGGGETWLHDAQTGTLLREMTSSPRSTMNASFNTDDGILVVIGLQKGLVQLWRVRV